MALWGLIVAWSAALGLAPDIVNAITGHLRKTVADSYGEFPIDAHFREIAKIPAFADLPASDVPSEA